MVTIDNVKKVRVRTNLSLSACKRALECTGNDVDRAVAALLKESAGAVERRADKVASEGCVNAYVHQGRIGVLVEVRCETDFAARSLIFRQFCEAVCMQVAAMDPRELDGVSEASLLAQESIFDPTKTIRQVLDEASAQIGEKMEVKRFVRWELGS